jgi:hypothetical protein
MIAITPIQSAQITAEIREQAELLDDAARDFAEPWGALSKARMLRLRSRRLHVILPIPGMSQ